MATKDYQASLYFATPMAEIYFQESLDTAFGLWIMAYMDGAVAGPEAIEGNEND